MEKEENLKTPCYLFDEKECRERTRKTKHEIYLLLEGKFAMLLRQILFWCRY